MQTKNSSKHILPLVRIKNAWLLRENVSVHLHELWGKGEPLADNDWVEWKVSEYRKAWQPYEEKILLSMTDTLGLSFRQNIIDVYIAPWLHAFSDPLVIGVNKEPDVFVDLLTHELLHRLLTDNTSTPHKADRLSGWRKIFGDDHSSKTLVHIPVHAVHKAIYLNTLEESERLARNIANDKKHGAIDYIAAWEYVEKHGYRNVIDQLRKSYEDLSGK